jgi:diguanylate cyclase (GGDEF)-like protein/PAS domain S-box-containing protein
MDQVAYDFEKLRLETERLKERLLKSEERYRILYEENPSMYFTVDARGTVISVNSFGAKQLGYGTGELIGKSVLMVFHPEDHETVTAQLKKCLLDPEKLYQWDLRKVRKDNTVIWVRESARVFGKYEEELIMIVCEDVTENKRVEQALRKAYDELETRVREKTSDLIEANESLQAEIIERERKETELKIINSITQAMNQSIDLDDVFRIALDKVVEQGYVDIACVYLVDNAKNEAVLQDHRGFPDDFLRRASRIPKPKGVTWKVIDSGEILNVRNASEDAHVGPAGRDLGFRSMLGIPIKLETKTIGVIWLLSYTEHVFTQPEVELLVSIGDQIAIAVARANLYGELTRKNRYETIIATVTRSIHKSIDLQEVLENSVEVMSNYIDVVEHVAIYLVEGDELVMRAYRGHPDWFVNRVRRIPYPKGFAWKTIIDGSPIYCEDVDKDDVIGPAGREVGTKSYASMPVKYRGNTVGTIAVHSFRKYAFDDEDLRLLEMVSGQIEVAINNASQAEALKHSEEILRENLAQLSKKNRYETIVSSVTQIVHKSINLHDVLDNAVEAMHEKIEGCDNVCIYMVEGQEAVMKANRGYPKWFIERIGRIPYPRGFTWKTIIEERPLYVADAEKDTVIGRAGLEVGTKSYASMPIQHEGKTIGCININSLKSDAFDEEELNLLDIIAKQIETAVINARHADALRQSEERHRILFDQSPLGVFIIDRELKIDKCNKQLVRIFKSSYDKIIGLDIDKLRDKSFFPVLKGALEGHTNHHESFYEPTTSDAKLWLSVTASPLLDSDGNVVGAMGVVEDITERKRQEAQIHHMAMHDSLTDLPNRRALQDALDGLLRDSDSLKKHALVVMDLDDFKLINDTLGHLEGDHVLRDLANALREAMRPSDLLARVGGDEFAMVIRDVSRSQVKSIAERFSNVISGQTYYLKGYNFQINLSFGISLIDGRSDPQMIMASAYSALAEAKYEGKNRIIIHDSKHYSGVEFAEASQWGIRISDALRENRFVLHYQPVISLVDGEAVYFEGLVRMIEGDNEIIYPKSFIPAAERFGLVSKVDWWVVERVIATLGKKDGFRIFTNLSGSSLRDESLLGFIENSLKGSKIVSNHIGFEITEFTSITNMDRIVKWMSKLRELGCQFALDDFGMGYCSFAHLLDLPVDYVKIDGSFVQSLDTDPASSAIVKAIVSVSRLMGKEVIAEGVETESVRKLLRRLKVKYGQGNYFKPPSADKNFIT